MDNNQYISRKSNILFFIIFIIIFTFKGIKSFDLIRLILSINIKNLIILHIYQKNKKKEYLIFTIFVVNFILFVIYFHRSLLKPLNYSTIIENIFILYLSFLMWIFFQFFKKSKYRKEILASLFIFGMLLGFIDIFIKDKNFYPLPFIFLIFLVIILESRRKRRKNSNSKNLN